MWLRKRIAYIAMVEQVVEEKNKEVEESNKWRLESVIALKTTRMN